jgi:hypothetical protein
MQGFSDECTLRPGFGTYEVQAAFSDGRLSQPLASVISLNTRRRKLAFNVSPSGGFFDFGA